jgi:hypothetical protein
VLTEHSDCNPGAVQEQQDLLSEALGSVGWHSRVTGSPTDEQLPKPWTRAVYKGHHDYPFDMVMRNDTTPRHRQLDLTEPGLTDVATGARRWILERETAGCSMTTTTPGTCSRP